MISLKAIRSIFCIIIFGLIIASCAKEDEGDKANVGTLTYPVASFSFSGNEGPAPVNVTFKNTSQYSDAFEWDFGDGSAKSTEFSPTHTYNNSTGNEKTYTVKLTATDTPTGLSNTRSRVITIKPGK
jgi:PKD repeat protein